MAISLHATIDAARTRIVPVNKKDGLADLIETCRNFPLANQRRITFEYVLLAGENDTPEDARRLSTLLDGIKAKVNLLPTRPRVSPSNGRVTIA